MTSLISRPRKVLAVLEAGPSRLALDSAAALAEKHEADLEAIVCVEPPRDMAIIARLSGHDPKQLTSEMVECARRAAREQLSAALGDRAVELHVAVGKPFLEIIRHVARHGFDFLVKKAETLSASDRFLFSSTDQHLLRKCPCPVWLQVPAAPVQPRRILAAVDLDVWDAEEPETLSGLNRRVIDVARSVAAGVDAEVVVLHAWEAIAEGMVWTFSGDARVSADRYIDEVRRAREDAMYRFLASLGETIASGPPMVPLLKRGAAEQVIEEASSRMDADVVVMGTVARTGLGGLFIGNTAENIINSLERSVLAVKPEGFVSPLL